MQFFGSEKLSSEKISLYDVLFTKLILKIKNSFIFT